MNWNLIFSYGKSFVLAGNLIFPLKQPKNFQNGNVQVRGYVIPFLVGYDYSGISNTKFLDAGIQDISTRIQVSLEVYMKLVKVYWNLVAEV